MGNKHNKNRYSKRHRAKMFQFLSRVGHEAKSQTCSHTEQEQEKSVETTSNNNIDLMEVSTERETGSHTEQGQKRSEETLDFIDLMPVPIERFSGMEFEKTVSSTEPSDVDLTYGQKHSDTNSTPNNLDESGPKSIIDNSEMEVSHIKSEESSKILYGRRLVDIHLLLENLKEIANHKSLFNCGLGSIELVTEIQKGLYSRLTFKCNLCKAQMCIDNTNPEVNKEAVSGIMATGGGYAQLKQFTSSLDLPEISENKYIKIQNEIADEWDETAWLEMKKAGEMEREAALKEGRVNKDGIAMIDVIVDGCWCKRSYQTNYAANSGCATIIGRRTGKVLFMAVKNKYCCICQRNSDNPKEHRCFKNYQGPSTGMEAMIIAEGFQKSVEMHNLIYERFIADGDSSTYAKIIETRPYPNVTVEKINCRNHILRRFCSNMQKLCTDTRYPVKDRKLLTKMRILSARKYICQSIKVNKVEKKYETLYFDINNSVFHAFEKHNKCNREICCKTAEKVSDFDISSLWHRIKMLAANVASHSRSLLEDVDSNIVEQFNAVIAKFVGGKRINYSQRRGYQTRCAAAVISFNSRKLLSTVHKNKHGMSPRIGIKKYESAIHRKRQHGTLKKRKRIFTPATPSDIHYGENADQPDMDQETFAMAKVTFLQNLHKTEEERKRIAEQTILQSESSEWLELRRNLLTASNFGKIVKRRRAQSCQNVVKNLLYSTSIDHVSSVQHGRQYESTALQELAEERGIEIKKCGLYIDDVHEFLGATPDGITDDMVVEVKCPIAPFKMGSIDDAIAANKMHFWKKDKTSGEVYINKKSDWYFQLQGQMHITKMPRCLFAVWYGNKKIKIEVIEKDDDFWRKEMEPKLISFYMDCLLPELVDPRFPKKKPIRDPDYVKSKAQIQNIQDPEHENAVTSPKKKKPRLDISASEKCVHARVNNK